MTIHMLRMAMQERGWTVSDSTLRRTIIRSGFSHVTIPVRAAQRDPSIRADFVMKIYEYKSYQLVWVDESARDNRTMIKKTGWQHKGAPTGMDVVLSKGKR